MLVRNSVSLQRKMACHCSSNVSRKTISPGRTQNTRSHDAKHPTQLRFSNGWINNLQDKPFESLYSDVATCIWAANSFLSVLMSAGLFLSIEEANHCYQVGMLLITVYANLSKTALDNEARFFKLRPKFHLMHHLVLDCRKASRRNPNTDATWMDEEP